jgi:divalent metal cation (Fe/Co/Zn/Cd) transporter
MSTTQSHAVAHDVQHRLRTEVPTIQDVVVHVEPEDKTMREMDALIPALRSVAEGLDIAIHNITARQVDGQYHVEAHVLVDGSLSLIQAHEAASRLEEVAKSQIEGLIEMVTHIEPTEEGAGQSPETGISADDVAEQVRHLLSEWDATMACHNVRVYATGDSWAASVHCMLDGRMPLQEAHIIASSVERRLRNAIPRLERVAVHAEPLAAEGKGAR